MPDLVGGLGLQRIASIGLNPTQQRLDRRLADDLAVTRDTRTPIFCPTAARKRSQLGWSPLPLQSLRSCACSTLNGRGIAHGSTRTGQSLPSRSTSVASASTQRDATDATDQHTTTALAWRTLAVISSWKAVPLRNSASNQVSTLSARRRSLILNTSSRSSRLYEMKTSITTAPPGFDSLPPRPRVRQLQV